MAKYSAEWRKKNREKRAEHVRTFKERHPEKIAEYSRGWRERHPNRLQASQVRQDLKRYGLTLEEYTTLLAEQGGACAICGVIPNGSKRLFIDHDHRCHPSRYACDKCRRGLLCGQCNFLIGNARESERILERSIAYLRRWHRK